jgi:hypothetical protein
LSTKYSTITTTLFPPNRSAVFSTFIISFYPTDDSTFQ